MLNPSDHLHLVILKSLFFTLTWNTNSSGEPWGSFYHFLYKTITRKMFKKSGDLNRGMDGITKTRQDLNMY